jgi:hypothetical protein
MSGMGQLPAVHLAKEPRLSIGLATVKTGQFQSFVTLGKTAIVLSPYKEKTPPRWPGFSGIVRLLAIHCR